MAARKFRMISAQESGIGGFLLFFALTQVLSIGYVAWSLPGALFVAAGPDAAVVAHMDPGYIPLVWSEFFYLIARGVAFIRAIIYAVIWLLYWRSSERVRLTFTPGAGMTEIPTPS